MAEDVEARIEAAVEERVEEALEEERRTSYLELFFDLVFVYAITQVTSLALSDTSAAGFGRSLVVLLLLWWAWSAYAWMTNAIDIEDRLTRILMFAGMAAAFMTAFAIPDAYEGEGVWFGASLLAVLVVCIFLYLRGTRGDPELLRSVARIAPFFLLGPVLVLVGGFLDGGARDGLWIAAILVNVAGALDAGGRTWRVSASHFAERHGLFVIIALGESIIAIGIGAAEAHRDVALVGTMLVALLGSFALWGAYFGYVAGAIERALGGLHDPAERGRLARDVFTFLHLPMIAGIVLFAVAAKKAVAHPEDPLSGAGRFALAAGIGLMLVALAGGRWRVARSVAWVRLLATAAVVVAAAALTDLAAVGVLAVCVGILTLEVLYETFRPTRPGRAGNAPG